MREAPVGLIGTFAASRPYLSLGLLAPGLVALAVVGARRATLGAGDIISEFALIAAAVVIAPMALSALAPDRGLVRGFFFIIVVAAIALFAAIDARFLDLPLAEWAPPRSVAFASLGFFTFLFALAPLSQNVARLGLLAPFGAVLGAAGACGFLAMEGFLAGSDGALAVGLATAMGVGAGVNVAADFAKFFSAGERKKKAAAAAGHGAVAPSAFSMMVTAIFFVIHSFELNFGAVDWRMAWAGITVAAASMVTALVAVTGSLSLASVSEQTAVDENRRRQWFALRWRPLRKALPATSAGAAVAIAGILVVIAAFEIGIAAPVRFIVFILLIWAAAAVAFVSVRTSALIALLLAASAILGDYAMAVLGVTTPSPGGRFAALSLCAAALGSMTASWRDAGETWRNARDIVENALSDGLRRFLFIIGAGAASFYVSTRVFAWEEGPSVIIYFLITSLISLALAPAAMTAMSAQFRN